jgi:hypothetical protein
MKKQGHILMKIGHALCWITCIHCGFELLYLNRCSRKLCLINLMYKTSLRVSNNSIFLKNKLQMFTFV